MPMHASVSAPAKVEAAKVEKSDDDRLAELASYGILDTPPEPQFDSIVALARGLFDTSIAAVTLIDHDRQWFKAQSGLDTPQTSREASFCSQAMEGNEVFVVPDARQDPRFKDSLLVVGAPFIRFYAGAPLCSPAGHGLGAMCVISPDPRADFSSSDRDKLRILAAVVCKEMELTRRAQAAHERLQEQEIALRAAESSLKNSLDYANLLSELQSETVPTEKLTLLAVAAWQQYSRADGILSASIKSIRERMTVDEYRAFLRKMPGFAI